MKFALYAQRRAHTNHYSLRKGDRGPGAVLHVVIGFTICLIILSRNINVEIFSLTQKSKVTHSGGNFQKFLCIVFIIMCAEILFGVCSSITVFIMTLHFG